MVAHNTTVCECSHRVSLVQFLASLSDSLPAVRPMAACSATFQGGRAVCHDTYVSCRKTTGREERLPRTVHTPSSRRCRCYGSWTYIQRCARRPISSCGPSAAPSVNTVYRPRRGVLDDDDHRRRQKRDPENRHDRRRVVCVPLRWIKLIGAWWNDAGERLTSSNSFLFNSLTCH